MGQANLSDIVSNQSASPAAPSSVGGTAKLSDIVDNSAPQSSTPAPPSLGSKVVEGAKESMIGQMAAPPASHLEAGIMTAGGPAALFAWRTAKGVYDFAAKLVSAEGPDQYALAKEDFGKAVDEFHAGRKGTAAWSAASGVADTMGTMTPAAAPIASRIRE